MVKVANNFDVDCVVIGAGVVGLAISRAISQSGLDVVVLEQERHFGNHTSSRNSEVIHAGIYYPKGSLKEKFCLKGRELLYDYCDRHHVSYNKIGKLIVATDIEQIPILEILQEKSLILGSGNLEWLDKISLTKMEPRLNAEVALFSKNTGIIDSHQYMLSLLGDMENLGGRLAINAKVLHIEVLSKGFKLKIDCGDANPYFLTTRALINSGGLFSWQVAKPIYDQLNKKLPNQYYAKGTYFKYLKKPPFNHLIYPVPVDGGLGIHVTIDQGGDMKFGPDVEWISGIDYSLNPNRKSDFYAAIKNYFPEIRLEDFVEDFVGIRPRVSPPGEKNDFYIDDLREEGVENCINLFGIESPGLTSSLAIAEYVNNLLSI